MFNVDVNPTFKRTIKFEMTDPATGEPMSLDATFRALRDAEAQTYDLATVEGSLGFLRAAIVSLDGIVSADKKAVPYTEALREQLLSQAWVRAGLATAYFKAVVGLREGNSDGLPAAGPAAKVQPATTTH